MTQNVSIRGEVRDLDNNRDFPTLMIVNKRTGQGKFAEPGGVFTQSVRKTDTLLIGARGYQTYELTMADSATRKSYQVEIVLTKLRFDLKEVEVFPERELSEIRRDIEKLGYDQRDYMLSGVNAFQSPITFLYEQFSRREQQKRLAYKLINEQKRRDLLKELFTKYVNHNIIDLSPEQFDAFIDYLDVSDSYLKSTSQYDFIMYVKARFQEFERKNDYR